MAAPERLAGKRILFVLCTLDLGGAERQALMLAHYLRRRCGAQVAIAALFGGTGSQIVRAHARDSGLPCLRFNMPDHNGSMPGFASVRHFARELRFLNPDILLPYTVLPNILCGAAWQAAGVPLCIWNQRDEGRELPHASFAAMALARTPMFISNSTAGRDCLIEHKVPAQRIHVIYNGVMPMRPTVARDALRHRLGLPQNAFVATMVANLHGYKDHATLLDAWRQVAAESSRPAHLLLAGRREDTAAALEKRAAELGLQRQVHFLGQVADVASLLAASDAAVHSSLKEGLPNAILEAMALGLPVAATRIPGAQDALGSDYPLLTAPRDAASLAEGLLKLEHDAALCARLSAANRARAQSEFSTELLGQRSARLLAQALEEAFVNV